MAEDAVLKQGNYLIATLQKELPDTQWRELERKLLDMTGKYKSRGVIIELTALNVLDSFATRTLSSAVKALKLRGAQTVISGLQPEIAMAIVQLGLAPRLADINTVLDLEEGLAFLDKHTKAG